MKLRQLPVLFILMLALTSCIQIQVPTPVATPMPASPTTVPPSPTPVVLVITATPVPSATRIPPTLTTVPPSPTTIIVIITTTPAPSATPTPGPTQTPLSEAAKKCGNVPTERACLWIHNYRGGNDTVWVTINQSQYPIGPGGDVIIYITPGRYRFSANIPGAKVGTITGTIECPKAGESYSYFFY